MISKINIVVVLLFILLFSCRNKECKALEEPTKGCNKIYKPVCGCDGETYGNPCMAESYGIDDYVDGECK